MQLINLMRQLISPPPNYLPHSVSSA